MKLLKIFGIVAGLHVLALLLILTNPGCSATSRPAAAATAQPPPGPDPAPTIAPSTPVAPADENASAPGGPISIVAAPAAPNPEPAPGGGAFYNPTRPGTPAAAVLAAEPASDVTPATPYTVGKGDSLWSIAKKNHIKVSVLAAANHLKVGSRIHPGQKVLIPAKAPESAPAPAAGPPAPSSSNSLVAEAKPAAAAAGGPLKHVVRSGETLGSIARHYGVRVGDLATANAISDPQKIHPGQELTIPSTGHASGAKPAAAATAPIPAPTQDLDSGLKTVPAAPVPVIRIDPDAPPSSPPKQP